MVKHLLKEKINEILKTYYYLIEAKTSHLSLDIRHQVEQEMYIRFWRALINKWDNKLPIDEFIKSLNFVLIYKCSYYKILSLNRIESNSTSVEYYASKGGLNGSKPLPDELTVFPNLLDQLSSKDFLERLYDCLDRKERIVIDYILLTGNIGDNLDQLSRQLGYQGKGGSKYLLNNILIKMRKFADEQGLIY